MVTGDATTVSHSDDSSTGDVPVVPEGPWCGRTETEVRILEGAPSGVARFDSSAGPLAHAVWYGETWVRAAAYDAESGAWGDTVLLSDGISVHPFGRAAPGGVSDSLGNAFVIHALYNVKVRVLVHRRDVETGAWDRADLDGTFSQPLRVEVNSTDDGRAVALVVDLDAARYPISAHFYDPISATWSKQHALGTSEYPGVSVPLSWRVDPATGDSAYVIGMNATEATLLHHNATTNEWTSETLADVDFATRPEIVVLRPGEFALMVQQSDELLVRRFVRGAWQAGEVMAASAFTNPEIAAARDGRIAVGWFAPSSRLKLRVFDRGMGSWSAAEDMNPELQTAMQDSSASVFLAHDDAGVGAAWSQIGVDGEARSYARRRDNSGAWASLGRLDAPDGKPASVSSLTSLDGGGMQAVFARSRLFTDAHYYACEVPGSEWTNPTFIGDDLFATQEGPDGGVIVIRGKEGDEMTAQLFH